MAHPEYSAFAIANAFVQKAGQGAIPNLTPMKLQKLLYFTQAWHLKVRGFPLLDDHFARWKHGPVIPAVYHEFRAYGHRPITRKATTLAMSDDDYAVKIPMVPLADRDTWGLIDAIIDRYGAVDAQELSRMTHLEGSAWATGGGADGTVITAEQIRNDPSIQ
ncbi:Panacea domain-containing protein [Verminephrobacter eiseniae]|uniref:Antitoxin SocA-like Panacea domain-containing protein n=1 Tax=Verminephrobacter eiseniae (strain EF01-2) TaxID=391735 RepID=A1WHI3_VEREI|nr:type II toxin-antitoxin system antitoxin SocA domain-containing protein [Verminephrobacter eiseniae]ABM57090.1 conserved hypothetical protein [Verminephrobacter eiseniae EF01-2]MCW5287426.1 DUF4065 domain-containing protein [Verminephrobacter eiseniae]MCW5305725.1 DUF4065 domain-containing protein [Verminephrobacter eiseniae]MCW8180015.1 DUF4065 domain-containing protein [Verminephrobacter eiseniae]MCW8188469.1 DUF4065 domain-containing protein [Verminephrobacter eiseniae]